MFKILKGGWLFTPDEAGKKDLVIAGCAISNIGDNIRPVEDYGEVEVIDVSGKYVVPGFIDQHVHLIGGGGETGYASRTPEVMLSDVIRSGITTVVGCLGTDGTTRHAESLLAKARGLEIEGISTYIYIGSYQVPPKTITGSVRDDIILIDKVIGCGEIAISDHRSAQPTKEDIAKLAAEARVGGILSGKAGVLHLHVGDGPGKLGMLFEIVDETEIPISQFTPTHVNRNPYLLEDAIAFAKRGGMIDITSGVSPASGAAASIEPYKAVLRCLESGVPIDRITMSSDGNGSMPIFDEKGQVQGLLVATLTSLYDQFRALAASGPALQDVLKVFTLNPARSLKLYPQKGAIQIGSDADILVMDEDFNIEYLFAKGRCVIRQGELVAKGTFE